MQIASHSTMPSLSRLGAPSLSAVFAPVQALMAFFMPSEPAQAKPVSRPAAIQLPLQQLSRLQHISKPVATVASITTCSRPASRLKIMREFEPGLGRSQVGRMAISGRMADVCAELDRIARKESIKR